MSKWGWPQIVYIILTIIGMGIYAIQHGKPKDGNYNFFIGLVSAIIEILILKAGGFF